MDEVEYVLEAILFVASDNGGWKLLPQYIFNQVNLEISLRGKGMVSTT
jgi:hypothetical protein